MSSAAARPLTIVGAEKNTQYPDVARAVIPATVNIHLINAVIDHSSLYPFRSRDHLC